MKVCTACKLEKELSEFNKKKKGLQPICRSCNSIMLKKHYKNNKQYYFKKARNQQEKLKRYFKEYKQSLSCVDCGISFKEKPWLCDFHHLGDKDFSIATKSSYLSIKTLTKELNKCVPLCANCHRTRHWNMKLLSGVIENTSDFESDIIGLNPMGAS